MRNPQANTMKITLLVALAAALILSAAGAASEEPVTAPKDTGFTDVPLENLAAQFREIRKIEGHFDGGTWNDEVDRWEGRKHRLMSAGDILELSRVLRM
jgi:hypothetical protein